MFHRRAEILAAAAVLLAACTDTVDTKPPASEAVIAVFESPLIPTPNDLALAAAPTLPAGPGRQFLELLAAQGGFPSDQAPTLTVPLKAVTYDAAGGAYVAAEKPSVDVSTVTPSTFALFKLGGGAAVRVETEPLPAASQVAGELRVVPKADASGSRRLAPGRYVFAVRGGDDGVKTTAGLPISPDSAIALVIPNRDLTSRENQPVGGLSAAQVAQLESVRKALWAPLEWSWTGAAWAPAPDAQLVPAFSAVDAAFPHEEVASIATFEIAPAPAGAAVLTDSGSGQLPFPSDFLLDPARPVPGTNNTRFFVRNVPSLGAAAPGLATLDGFSTTSLLLTPLSAPVVASTINRDTVRIYELVPTGANPPFSLRQLADLTGGGAPEYLTQPPSMQVTTPQGAKVSTAIGLQPAVPVPDGSGGVVALPPLKQKTRYLVLVTDGVKDTQGQGLQRSTLGKILFELDGPLYDAASGQSTVGGLGAADAAGLQGLRGLVQLVAPTFEVDGHQVVMAYTVSTQSVSDVSASLAALPYGAEAAAQSALFTVSDVADFDPAAVGVPAAAFPAVPRFLSASVASLDVLDAATGALDPSVATWGPAEYAARRTELPAIVALPDPAAVASPCGAEPPASLLKCAPLVVFHHGLNGGRYQMLAVANDLAARGFVVAAIDAPFHGDRAFCAEDADCDGGTCALDAANQKAPGVCTSGSLAYDGLTPVASGNYFISENFFRIRDAIRADLLDHSAAILALARPPAGVPQQADNPLQAALLEDGLAVRSDQVYFAGVSLGGMIGTSLTATNPRVARAALNVAGGTMVDVFTTAPAFQAGVGELFARLIPGFTFQKVDSTNEAFDPAIAARYAQTLIVAKWILDPAEPLNYAAEADSNALASSALVTALGPLAPAQTAVYGQLVQNDPVVPNAFNLELYQVGGIPFTLYTSGTLGPAERHGLIGAPTAAGAQVRADLADFLAGGSPTTGPVALP